MYFVWQRFITIISLLSVAMVALIVTIQPVSAQQDGLELSYFISYSGASPRVTLEIENITTPNLDLVVSPLLKFGDGREETLLLVKEIHAVTETGDELQIKDLGYITNYYQLVNRSISHRFYRISTNGASSVTVTYSRLSQETVGFLETVLLRPRDHKMIGQASLKFDIPDSWRAVTVVEPDHNGIFDLGTLDGMYGDNADPVYNFVEMGFAVGNTLIELDADCGRLIFVPSFFREGSKEALLGLKMYDYFCEILGPLEPYNTYIASLEWPNWYSNPEAYQPALYSWSHQHARTIDFGQSPPRLEYTTWQLVACEGTAFICDLPPYTYYGFPHKFLRAWFTTGLLALDPQQPDWFIRGAISHYLQEKAMQSAYGLHMVYQRFYELYITYNAEYANTPNEFSLMSNNGAKDHFTTYFKSGLWAFYLNQRMLEVTDGEKNIEDLAHFLYENYAGTGEAFSYLDIQNAIATISGADLSDMFTLYAYTREPLLLDEYFQDDDNDGLGNGLEMELGLNPNSADTDQDSIDDANEYAKECKAAVLNTIYCDKVVPAWAVTPTSTSTPRPTSTFTFTPTSKPTLKPTLTHSATYMPIGTPTPTTEPLDTNMGSTQESKTTFATYLVIIILLSIVIILIRSSYLSSERKKS